MIAAFSCGTEALTLGSLMMLASGWVASVPSSARSSLTFWSSCRKSGNCDRMRAASEISRVSTAMPAVRVKASTMGSSDWVARYGASSVRV